MYGIHNEEKTVRFAVRSCLKDFEEVYGICLNPEMTQQIIEAAYTRKDLDVRSLEKVNIFFNRLFRDISKVKFSVYLALKV